MRLKIWLSAWAFFPAMKLAIAPQKFIALLKYVKTAIVQCNVKIVPPIHNSFAIRGFWHGLGKNAQLIIIR
tara:strand:+ start:88 stop:300 length:213 start_codon:yes stop_codon:yes gene_type:complete